MNFFKDLEVLQVMLDERQAQLIITYLITFLSFIQKLKSEADSTGKSSEKVYFSEFLQPERSLMTGDGLAVVLLPASMAKMLEAGQR